MSNPLDIRSIKRGDILDPNTMPKVILGPARLFPQAAISDGKRWDVWGVDTIPLRKRYGKIDYSSEERGEVLTYSIQCETTLGTDCISPHAVIQQRPD